ncbi:MAG: CvpA family protein [Zoogloeaceae bacterium]|jgi:membrane protein required for colicin V production|nr:CvpA family protein [Zoogloeaceae bacterium]
MTVFDYVVLTILALSMFLGVWRGVVGEIIALLSLILAFFTARAFGEQIGQQLFADVIADPFMRIVAGWIVVFFAVLILLSLVRYLARRLIHALGLGVFDRLAGLFFGFLRGLCIALILVTLGGLTQFPQQPWWREAKLSRPLEIAVLAMRPWLPVEIAKRIRFRKH